jgi:hypothetical protein
MESAMNEDAVRDDIAFIRRTIEQGRRVAVTWSADMLVWGVAVTIGYVGTYARVRGWWTLDPRWLWAACIVLPWIYSLRRLARRLLPGRRDCPAPPPMIRALSMLWFACGICLTVLGAAVSIAGDGRQGWLMDTASAGVMGIGFFVSSFLCNLAWMRWVAVAWWAGELATYVLRERPEGLLLAGVLMLLFLALPGLVLLRSRSAQADA